MLPRTIHIIWFGPILWLPYELNILRLILNNQDFLIRIYRDQDVELTRSKFRAYRNVRVIDYRDVYRTLAQDYPDSSLNLPMLEAELSVANGNLAAASDIFRIDLLMYEGGYYVDTDLVCLSSFIEPPSESLPHGFKIHADKFIKFKELRDSQALFNNDFMMAIPEAPVIQHIRKTIHENYQKKSNGDLTAYLQKRAKMDSDSYRFEILETSGPDGIDYAMKTLWSRYDCIYSQDIYLLPVQMPYLKFQSDMSWLPTGALALKDEHLRMQAGAEKLQRSYRKWLQTRRLS
jgi:hypothetical protein